MKTKPTAVELAMIAATLYAGDTAGYMTMTGALDKAMAFIEAAEDHLEEENEEEKPKVDPA